MNITVLMNLTVDVIPADLKFTHPAVCVAAYMNRIQTWIFFCVWWSHVITLTGRLLCSVSVWWACELCNMGSNVRARQTVTLLASRNSAASWWLFALPPREQKQPFVNVHSGDKGWETETYFSMLFSSCWCLRTICFFPLLYRPKQYHPFKCQAHAYSDC